MIFFSVLWRCQLRFSLVGKGRGWGKRGISETGGEGRKERRAAAEIHAALGATKKTCLLTLMLHAATSRIFFKEERDVAGRWKEKGEWGRWEAWQMLGKRRRDGQHRSNNVSLRRCKHTGVHIIGCNASTPGLRISLWWKLAFCQLQCWCSHCSQQN